MSNSKSDVRWAGWELSEVESRRISSSSWSDTNHSDSEPPTSLRCTNCCCSCRSKTYPESARPKSSMRLVLKSTHSHHVAAFKVLYELSTLLLLSRVSTHSREVRRSVYNRGWVVKQTIIFSTNRKKKEKKKKEVPFRRIKHIRRSGTSHTDRYKAT